MSESVGFILAALMALATIVLALVTLGLGAAFGLQWPLLLPGGLTVLCAAVTGRLWGLW